MDFCVNCLADRNAAVVLDIWNDSKSIATCSVCGSRSTDRFIRGLRPHVDRAIRDRQEGLVDSVAIRQLQRARAEASDIVVPRPRVVKLSE